MKTNARRIVLLSLVLVLVCSLAVIALANDTHSHEAELNGGTIYERARIDKTKLWGDITVEDEAGKSEDYTRQVTMELWYIAEDDTGDPTTYKWPTTISVSGSGPNVNTSKTITSTTVYGREFVCLSYANYSCVADVVNGTTVQRYTHGPIYFSYLML